VIKLDAALVHGIADLFLKAGFDKPHKTPDFHDEMWELCCTDKKYVAIAAPRGHAKSTAITHTYLITSLLFRVRKFALLVSDTESQAAQFLGDIKRELSENEDLIAQFGIKKFAKESETDIIVEFDDGEQFRILAKGSEQKIRGLKWRGMRPDIIAIDDAENDEIVMNPERREKFRNWFMNALLPCGGDDCIIRMVGTILHLDSMLQRLLNNKIWSTLKFSAHEKDFTNILWPEKFPKQRLMDIRANYEEEGNLEGYSQEFLNHPVADGATYFRKEDFIPMDAPDYELHRSGRMIYVAAADFAISEKEKADNTVIMVAGIDDQGFIHIVDVRVGKIGSLDIIEELMSVQRRYHPEVFTFETEKIDKAIGPFLDLEMRKTGDFINIDKVTPSKSKTVRGKSIQAAMKSGSVRFDVEADWYPDFYSEMMTITPAGPKGKHDDQFDAFAYIGLTVHKFNEAPTAQEAEDEEWDDEFESDSGFGVCATTGY
jgi:predicted phage terminase large subunit-like protein